MFALYYISVNLRERGERESPKRDTVLHSQFFQYCRPTWGVYCPYFCRHQAVIFILLSVNNSPSRICVIMNHFLEGVCLKRANTAQLRIQGICRVRNGSVLACALLCLWCWIHYHNTVHVHFSYVINALPFYFAVGLVIELHVLQLSTKLLVLFYTMNTWTCWHRYFFNLLNCLLEQIRTKIFYNYCKT